MRNRSLIASLIAGLVAGCTAGPEEPISRSAAITSCSSLSVDINLTTLETSVTVDGVSLEGVTADLTIGVPFTRGNNGVTVIPFAATFCDSADPPNCITVSGTVSQVDPVHFHDQGLASFTGGTGTFEGIQANPKFALTVKPADDGSLHVTGSGQLCI